MQQVSAYPSVPLSVPLFEVGERFGLKNGGGGTAFPHTLTTGSDVSPGAVMSNFCVAYRLGVALNGA